MQKTWTKIASNVKKFKACSDSKCIAYIDKSNDLWVVGGDTWVLGMNTDVSETQNNFVRLKDVLKNTEIHNHIDKKVVDYYFGCKKMYILTDETDGNSLYVSGHYLSYSWTKYSYLGTGKDENCILPTKILDGCEKIIAADLESIALRRTESGFELYMWGVRDGGCIPVGGLVPAKWTNGDSIIKNADNVDIWLISYDKSYIGYEKDGVYHLMVCGRERFGALGPNGVGKNVSDYTELSYGNSQVVNKFICGARALSFMFSTLDGDMFGFGYKKLMGKNTTSSEFETSVVPINFDVDGEKAIDIAGGNGWYIITTENGRVFGTGSNNYGILGRWKGVSRGSSNSRYKTAFEWVECPDLEI